MLAFLLRRLAAAAATLLVASILVFAATELLPGNVASAVLGKSATPEAVAELEAQLGLDAPAWERYLEWLGGFVRGDLGDSAAGLASGAASAPIWDQISGPIGNTLVLAGIAFLVLVPASIVLGVVAARRAGRPVDHAIASSTLVAISLPEFVVGTLLVIVLFNQLDLLPPVALIPEGQGPLDEPSRLVMPVLTLLATSLAWTTRLVRAGMVEQLDLAYVEQARLDGQPERRVVWRFALRNALAPSVQVFALTLQYLIGGVILTEVVFSYPGIGKELVDAVAIRDVREVQGVVMLIATLIVLINVVADLLVVFLVPKLRTAAR